MKQVKLWRTLQDVVSVQSNTKDNLASDFRLPEPAALSPRTISEVIPSAQCQVICVASGKGGTGKTTLTTNLAICLAQRGLKTLIVDADLGLANAHLLLGLKASADVSHVLDGTKKIQEIIMEGPAGVHLVPGGSGFSHLSDLKDHELRYFASALLELEGGWDVVLVDLSAGISPQVMRFLAPAHEIILVTNPEVTALMDAYALLKSLTALKKENQSVIRCIINRVQDEREAKNALQRIRWVTSKHLPMIQLVSWGYIPYDRHLLHSIAVRQPVILLHPRSFVTTCFTSIANRIIALHDQWKQEQSKRFISPSYFAQLNQQIYE